MPDDQIEEYEVSLLAEVLAFCERCGQPYIHDFELKELASGKSPVMLRDFLWKLHLKDYVEQNESIEWASTTKTETTHYWWRLTPKAVGVLRGITSRPTEAQPFSQPVWMSKLSDYALRSILDEVYRARDSGFLMLPLIGARTAFDRAMSLKVGDSKGGFREKLSAMQKAGLLDNRGAGILAPMIDAGNAAAHRGWVPTRDILDVVISEVERQLHDWFLRDDGASRVRSATPRREG